jgi:hypothetical protein
VYIIFIMQPLALGFTKLAFLFFYRRIFVWAGFQKTSLVFIIVTASFTLAFFFGFIFDCRLNFAANWGSLASIGENCPFGFQATIIFTVIDAALDFLILLLPLPWVWIPQPPTPSTFPVECKKALTIDRIDLAPPNGYDPKSPTLLRLPAWRLCRSICHSPHGNLHPAKHTF